MKEEEERKRGEREQEAERERRSVELSDVKHFSSSVTVTSVAECIETPPSLADSTQVLYTTSR